MHQPAAGGPMRVWILIAVAGAIAIYVIVIFNRLVRLRQMVNEAWSGIDVQLKRRSDLVPNLVEAVKGYAEHERGVLTEVTELRGAARQGRRGPLGRARQAVCRRRRLSRSQGQRKFPRTAERAQRPRGRPAD